ncbi:MAG: tRNA (N(6)-L-threonylcarbamoyladenosine(37)-C(2))-methylthiotransferase MtaB [Thermoflexales bacterium]|nr:tRNA (N(6)-L-threonylcarbamoyladenosine(37)-C(2))-methylthiotransferase MtaB [Thermoflexales bacterium]
MRVYLHSLGCRLNQGEIESVARQLAAAGHTVTDEPGQAEVCIVNTCAVTAEAEHKSRRCARALARANPQAQIAVVGCYATLDAERCAALPGVRWVVPNAAKERVVELVSGGTCEKASPVIASAPHLRTRAFVKVQDGCDNACTYCLVRRLRGPGRSRPLADVLAEVQALERAGGQEVVLSGVNLSSYGRDLELAGGLRTLVSTLLAYSGLPRLRLSSLEPWNLDEDFFTLWENPRLCRQLHLPLQAGCDDTLRRMGRDTTTAEFARLVEAARATIPGMALTTDIITGFPGEDKAAWQSSYEFVKATAFARLHVFPYSPRPGTAATRLPGQLPREVGEARARLMRQLGAEQSARFRRQFVGHDMAVLWEQRRPDGTWLGLTGNYIQVATEADGDLHNRITNTRITAVRDGGLVGEIVV